MAGNGNIIGDPFDDWVREQINTRQAALGKNLNIDSNTLKYYSTKSPFMRLASSVNLTNNGPVDNSGNTTQWPEGASVLNKLSKNFPSSLIENNNLAKNFILQGGAVDDKKLNFGLNTNNSIFNGAYGWGGIEERGYVPMPGITGASVQYYNNGALSKTSIKIKCFSKKQFQLIDALYLRPGYSLLLEFGWSVYLNNKGQLETYNSFDTAPLNAVLNAPNGTDQYVIYRLIQEERKKHYGNYEAIFGKIVNFDWSFNSDGSYDCSVSLTGMGDVLESLKVNIVNPSFSKKELTPEKSPQATDKVDIPLIANANKTALNAELFKIYQNSKEVLNRLGTTDYSISDFPNYLDEFKTVNLTIKNGILTVPGTTTDDEKEQQSPQVYMTFGSLLAFVEARLLIYDKKNNKQVPITRFNVNFIDPDNSSHSGLDKDKNFILRFNGQFSADPRICLIPVNSSKIKDLSFPKSNLYPILDKGARWVKGDYLGRLMNIYVNVNYISSVLENTPPDEDNSISILNFLQNIIGGITSALGGINSIRIQSTADGLIKFFEEAPQTFNNGDNDEPKGTYTRFNVFGVKPGVEGSFIRNVSLNANIPSNFASMISIGAQANANQISENATSFSNYNAGLEDRIIKEKKSFYPQKSNTNNEDTPPDQTIQQHFEENIHGANAKLFEQVYGSNKQFTSENISALISHNTQYSKMSLGEYIKIPNYQKLKMPFFLPFNLSLEMDGISGIVLYQKFLITDDILPPSYEKDGVDLIVKGLNHEITQQAWTTKIESLSVPAAKNADGSPLDNINRPVQKPSPYTSQKTPLFNSKKPPQELIKAMKEYGITDPLEKSHFLAQTSHESGGFNWKQEFASGEAYEGRKDLGNTQLGDGRKFKGRGYIQITGRDNYTRYNEYLKSKGIFDDVIKNPDLVATKFAADSSCYWWKYLSRGITNIAKSGSTPNNVTQVTRRVNGGTNGLADRQQRFNSYWDDLKQDPSLYS